MYIGWNLRAFTQAILLNFHHLLQFVFIICNSAFCFRNLRFLIVHFRGDRSFRFLSMRLRKSQSNGLFSKLTLIDFKCVWIRGDNFATNKYMGRVSVQRLNPTTPNHPSATCNFNMIMRNQCVYVVLWSTLCVGIIVMCGYNILIYINEEDEKMACLRSWKHRPEEARPPAGLGLILRCPV